MRKQSVNRKEIIKIFKNIGFQIEIQTNLKLVDFLDVTFNLANNTYQPYKKPNDNLLYINTSSNHPPQIIKHLPVSINDRLSKNSSSEEIFNSSKHEYEKALKDCGYSSAQLKYNSQNNKTPTRNRKRNILWFNPPFSKNVSTNVAKTFLNLLDRHFPTSNKLHKIFNRNTVKVSYSCTENITKIIKSHNKNVTNNIVKTPLPCNCRVKSDCPMDGKCRNENSIYKCIVSVPHQPDKTYIGLAEGEWKTRYYNHKKSFKNRKYANETTLSKYVWETKDKSNETPTLKWSIVKSVSSYTNISKRCMLCLNEKLAIITYPRQDELLNKKSELISKCRHANKFLLANYKSND